jgi:hypothetical protein
LSFNVMAPSMVPVASGVEVTLNVQDAPAASVLPHVEVNAKSPLPTMLVILKAVFVLVFFTVTVLASVVVPTACDGKASVVGDKVTVCA